MTIRFSCPKCNSIYNAPFEKQGKVAKCSKCKQSIIVPTPASIDIPQPGILLDSTTTTAMAPLVKDWQDEPPVAQSQKPAPKHSTRHDHEEYEVERLIKQIKAKRIAGFPFGIVVGLAGMGVVIGIVIGYLSAHYFAFFGGLLLIGEPHSPARASLVPAHMLFCATIFASTGGLLGYLYDRYVK